MKFIDLARQMEAFFLQKRFLLSALKPELILKEENGDLKNEITRKEELIRKHYEKIDEWKGLLQDQQVFYSNLLCLTKIITYKNVYYFFRVIANQMYKLDLYRMMFEF